MRKELFIVGTRPEIIKVAPILLKLNRTDYLLVHTGQHRELAKEAFDAFNLIPDIDFKIMTEDQSLASFAMKAFVALVSLLDSGKESFSRVWVQGDTSTALMGALVGNMFRIPVVHIEAGLRTYDKSNPWPEETFRTQIDSLSDILFAPTSGAKANLARATGKVYVTGNTIVDALEIMKKTLPKKSPYDEQYVLATVHRRESFGPQLIEIFSALKELSKEIKIVLPAHPNPRVREALKEVGLSFVEPMTYSEFLWHLKFCKYVITDSGGVQEEAPSFGKKTIVLRKKTERPEALRAGISILVNPLTKENIMDTIKSFTSRTVKSSGNPFGDGHASNKILNIIKQQV